MKAWWALAAALSLAACSGTPKKPDAPSSSSVAGVTVPAPPAPLPADCAGVSPYAPAQEDPSTRGDYVAGGLYKPGVRDSVPDYLPRVDCIPEPVVAAEPLSRVGNRSPYKVLGKSYSVRDNADGFVETGIASYYGNKFHGRRTSNQEVYDMYAFTAAHKSLPLPSFARVTNLDNGRSVVVRVNDRGPFHEGRVIDLSYAAAVKLDIHHRGTGRVEVRGLSPADARPTQLAARPPPAPSTAGATSGMDGLVQALPASVPATATAGAVPPGPAATAIATTRAADHPGYGRPENRFQLVQDGRVRTADEFDAWMRERQARIDAAAAPAAPATPTPAVATTGAPIARLAAAAPAPSPSPSPTVRPAPAGGRMTLQVGVFSLRSNAERALATLRDAGIAAAHLQDVAAAGKALWRVRVGGIAPESLSELSSRIVALGFGTPQVVRE